MNTDRSAGGCFAGWIGHHYCRNVKVTTMTIYDASGRNVGSVTTNR
jgi:hypothetical protein